MKYRYHQIEGRLHVPLSDPEAFCLATGKFLAGLSSSFASSQIVADVRGSAHLSDDDVKMFVMWHFAVEPSGKPLVFLVNPQVHEHILRLHYDQLLTVELDPLAEVPPPPEPEPEPEPEELPEWKKPEPDHVPGGGESAVGADPVPDAADREPEPAGAGGTRDEDVQESYYLDPNELARAVFLDASEVMRRYLDEGEDDDGDTTDVEPVEPVEPSNSLEYRDGVITVHRHDPATFRRDFDELFDRFIVHRSRAKKIDLTLAPTLPQEAIELIVENFKVAGEPKNISILVPHHLLPAFEKIDPYGRLPRFRPR